MSDNIEIEGFDEDPKYSGEIAKQVASMWNNWKDVRVTAEEEWAEIRRFIYATNTHDTIGNQLPFRNSTVTPKLSQIYKQLVSLIYNIKFASGEYVEFESLDQSAASIKKKDVINAYMKNIIKNSGFENTALRLDQDLYLYGNSFVKSNFVRSMSMEDGINPFNQEGISKKYVGPQAERISPFDIVFDPTATSFANSPKIVRKLIHLGDLKKQIASQPDVYLNEAVEKILAQRNLGSKAVDSKKDNGFKIDGFGSMQDYLSSGQVEVLEFYGDIYDAKTGNVYVDRTIMIADREVVFMNKVNKRELGEGMIFQNTAIIRPDNLWGQSPLANLTGMQFMIDKLQNGKADAMDILLSPPLKIKGDVDMQDYGPGAVYYLDRDGEISQMSIDSNFLQADFQIEKLEAKMERFAGLPSEAMGIRSKGEKTLGEVQMLENSALRQFNVSVKDQEKSFWEPLLNCMFVQAKDQMQTHEVVRIIGSDKTELYETINQSDLGENGVFRAIGTQRFDDELKLTNNLNYLFNSPLFSEDSFRANVSAIKLSETVAELTGFGNKGIIVENIGIEEQGQREILIAQLQMNTQSVIQQMQQQKQQDASTALQTAQREEQTLGLEIGNASLQNQNASNDIQEDQAPTEQEI